MLDWIFAEFDDEIHVVVGSSTIETSFTAQNALVDKAVFITRLLWKSTNWPHEPLTGIASIARRVGVNMLGV
jgi:hypothetical protein